MQTTFGREVVHHNAIRSANANSLMSFSFQLWFAGLHAVHHWSMVCVSQAYSHLKTGADLI
jgi:hypothetical protein